MSDVPDTAPGRQTGLFDRAAVDLRGCDGEPGQEGGDKNRVSAKGESAEGESAEGESGFAVTGAPMTAAGGSDSGPRRGAGAVEDADRVLWLALARTRGLGPRRLRALIELQPGPRAREGPAAR